MMNNKPAQLYNIEVYFGKTLQSTPFRNIGYGLAILKRKSMMAQGTISATRRIYIVKTK